jgi:SAM-dependent methyltransferase
MLSGEEKMHGTITHDASLAKRPIFDHLWSWLTALSYSLPSGIIAEVGVGPDGFVPFYAERFSRYIGLDVDDYRHCYGNVQNAEIIVYDGLKMPVESASVDFVASHSVFEHVTDVRAVLCEVNRILKGGGLFFLTINPLYYSSWGSHGTLKDHVTRLPPWEHLNNASPHYLCDCPPQLRSQEFNGCYLNKIRMSDLLAHIGCLPWSIVRLDRVYEYEPLPDFLKSGQWNEVDLRNHEFRALIRKDW